MGKATRWLKNLLVLGGKKEQKHSSGNNNGNNDTITQEDKRQKKRWSFAKSSRDNADAAALSREATWLKSLYAETEREQSKHAIAVAAATAAAADAAVAAAQAAVAVVRLTSQGPGVGFAGAGAHERLLSAAVKIQTAFRRYLAKKALRALKALVKLQALVRGYLVRKQAAAALHSMQALIRAQATIRAHNARNLVQSNQTFYPPIRPRYSLQERYDDTRSEHAAITYNRRLSASIESHGYDRSPKIVEIDTGRPKSRSSSRRTSPPVLDTSGDDYTNSLSSPLPPRISIPSSRTFQDFDWGRSSATAQSTPRYVYANVNVPVTPTKSVCGNCTPSYMNSTQSFEAKSRSQSAPKQRPEPVVRKRMPLSEVMVESRASLSGVGMQRSCNRVQETFNFKNAVVGKLDHQYRSSETGKEAVEREFYYLQRKW